MRYYLSILGFLLLFYHGVCQQYIESDFEKKLKFENLLNVSGVRFMQDSKGFIWITTNDGVRRYDGYTFKVFKNDKNNKNSLNVNPTLFIFESKDGLIWIGTGGGGVNIYDPRKETFEFLTVDSSTTNSLSSNLVYAICEDIDGAMWFGTFGGGVCRYNRQKKEFKRFMPEPNNNFSLTGPNVRDIVLDKNKQLWVGVDGGGLCRFERSSNRFIRYRHDHNDPTTLGNDIVLDVFVDKDGNFWTASWDGGISKFDPIAGKGIKLLKNDPNNPNSLANNISFGISQDPQGRMWFTTWKGLDIYDEKKNTFSHFVNDPMDPNSIPNDMLFDAFRDKYGCMWIHCNGGTCKINMQQKKFNVFDHDPKNKNSLINNDVSVISKMPTGEYWIASQNDGINIVNFETKNFKLLSHDPKDRNSPLSNSRPTVIFVDINNWVWLSTTAGIDVYNPFTLKKITTHVNDESKKSNDSLTNNIVRSMLNDRNGDLWMVTYGGGLFRYNYKTKKFKNYPIDAKNLINNAGFQIIMDNEGVIWVATRSLGLAYFDEKIDALRFYANDEKNPKSISTNNLLYVHEDADGILWIGTAGNGFDRFDRKSKEFRNFNQRKNGIAGDIVNTIVSQGKSLWLGTSSGLTKFDRERLVTVQNFDVTDDLAATAFNEQSVYRNESDLIFMGGSQGLTIFHPDSIVNNPIPPRVVLTDLKINNKHVVPGEYAQIQECISTAKQIDINYLRDKNIYIEFTVLHFTNPYKNQYKYMLEGFDTSWTTTTTDRRFAQYTNLSGGEYTFKVQGSNCDGQWDKTGASVLIIVHPPFYQTIWFYAIVVLVVLGCFYYIIKLREKRTLAEKKEMQEKINEAVSNVEEQKKEIMKQNDELQKSREIERQRQWFNEGIATFSDILRKHKDNVDELANVILQNVVRHINANQGGIYLLNDEDQTKKFLELHASYAYDVKKFGMRRVEIGETLVGNTFKEKITRHLKELPADYLKIGSGLGSAQPRELLIVPLKVEEIIIGVMELASLSEFSDIQVNFLEKLSENITSQLFNAKISSKTAKLLEQSQRMAEEMHTREIQITKHIQELEANKEQALILKRESDDFIASIDNSIMRANFDLNGKLVYANEIFKERLNISSYEAKFMRFTDCIEESQRILYNEFWPRLTNESTPIQHLFSFISTGEPVDMITVLTPVADINGRVTKVLLLAIEKK